MTHLSEKEMSELSGGQQVAITMCGITTGALFGATALFGVTGFILMVNKTLTACGIAAVQSWRGY